MKIVLCALLVVSSVFAYDENSDEFINEINSKQNFWKAGRNFPKDTPISHLRGLLGSRSMPKEQLELLPMKVHEIVDGEIPESFDAREKWPQCKLMNLVRDQSSCGSCWAVSVSSAISDRICVHSDGKLQPDISARNLMSCDTYLSKGCGGGWPYYAFQYWTTNGLATGGPYGSTTGCQSYPFPPCEHGDATGSKPVCTGMYTAPKCVKTCDNSTRSFEKELYFGDEAYRVSGIESQIQKEIIKNGPLVAAFVVYADFYHYKSGVYVQTSTSTQGRHAVRVLGWGVENGVKYWLVMNSWDDDWGEKGLFKIRRGVNECAFETDLSAALPKF